jgi:hypothetical protein
VGHHQPATTYGRQALAAALGRLTWLLTRVYVARFLEHWDRQQMEGTGETSGSP